jgi:type IV secretory pathway VirB4 component
MSKFKSEVAPKGMEFKATEFRLGSKYSTIWTIIGYPKSIPAGYLADLINIPGVKIAIKHIPIPFDVLRKMLNKEIADLKQRAQTEKDQTTQEKIRQDYESQEQFISMLASTQARIFDFQLHVMITGDSAEDLELKKIQVRTYLEGMGMRRVALMFEQEKVLKSILPIFPPQDIEKRIGTPIPSITVAAMYPFVFDSIKDPGTGTLLGVDSSGGVVLFNQFLYQETKESNRNNANMIILGTSGSGKSTAAKVILRSHIRNGCKIVCIDPEGELTNIVNMIGGDFIDLGGGGSLGMMNPLEVIVDYDSEDLAEGIGHRIFASTLSQLKAFMKYYQPSIEDDVLAMFSDVVQETYKRYRMDDEADFTQFTSADYPTFDDVYATIRGRLLSMTDATRERDVMERLELVVRPFTKELRHYFNGHTTLQIDSDFIVFSLKSIINMEENIKNALFFNILKYAWSQCLDKGINTVLMVDEAHMLLSNRNELGAEFLAQIQRRARKYNTGTIIITQQPTDFAAPNLIMHGKAIFDNASYYLVMGLRKQAIDDLAKLIDLNEAEKQSIKYYNQGDALFICGQRRMRISVVATQQELDSFGAGGGL